MRLEHRENMILYKVLNNEVVFEEYFCNLLRIDCFRNMFIKLISYKNTILNDLEIKYENFNTEITLNKDNEKYGRADLFLEVDNNEFIFEIKHKVRTSLTEKQPNKYLEYLNNQNQHLFFLIPKRYKHKKDIFDKWENFTEIENQIFYWKDLVEEIRSKNLQEQNIEIKIFYEFCEFWFDMKTIKFTGEEMELLKNKNIPSLMENLEDITRNISNRVGLNDKFETIGYCHTIAIKDYRVYFGIDYNIWKEKNLPLSILIQNHKENYQEFVLEIENIKLERMEYEETSTYDKQFGYVVILDEEIGSNNYEKIVEHTLRDIINYLKQT